MNIMECARGFNIGSSVLNEANRDELGTLSRLIVHLQPPWCQSTAGMANVCGSASPHAIVLGLYTALRTSGQILQKASLLVFLRSDRPTEFCTK
jgi:hypothetical protein